MLTICVRHKYSARKPPQISQCVSVATAVPRYLSANRWRQLQYVGTVHQANVLRHYVVPRATLTHVSTPCGSQNVDIRSATRWLADSRVFVGPRAKALSGWLAELRTFIRLTCFEAQRLLYVPPVLTFPDSAFCSHSVFMCFVWIWEQTAITVFARVICALFILF
jgi:hypothetical protein